MRQRFPRTKLDAALRAFISHEATARESAKLLRAMDVAPLAGPGADLLRAEVAAEVWHAAARILATALGAREATDYHSKGGEL